MAKKNNAKADNLDDSEQIEVKTTPKVNDIAKPGETPSLPTSRPIITSHSSMIKQDPMVSGKPDDNNDKADENDQAEKELKKLAKRSEIKLEPAEPQEQEDEPKNDTEPEKTEADEQNDEKPAEEDDASTSDSAAIDSLATNAEAKKASSKEAEEDQKRAEKIQELITEKKYYIPIREGGHKASSQRIMSWIFLILLLLVVILYLAIDAGYLDIGISLPFDLIKN